MTNTSEEGKTLDQDNNQNQQAYEKEQSQSESSEKQQQDQQNSGTSEPSGGSNDTGEKEVKKDTTQESTQKAESKEKDNKSSKSTKSSKTKEQKSKKTKEQKKIEELEAKVKDQDQKIEEQKDKFLRLYAEFENFRRRTSREKTELTKTAAEKIILQLLPVMDDYERAQQYYEENQDLEKFKEGIELIADKFWKIMKQEGLEPIESNNKEFNTDEHEAITKMPAPSEDMKGKVIDTTEKGYKLNGKVIRFAKVVVGN
ncbi:MAG: nucleotide exchange factor GrpE [Bacteroidales bacterium]|nr:nucleotide exchange factor GrpE [Bacteroidales bacterium]MCF8333811.1 nucleotide exchange factor GrpE [Bacteroidales bacterium]